MPEHPLTLIELIARLKWLIGLRWLAVAGIAAAGGALRLLDAGAPGELFAIALVLAAINTIYQASLRGIDGGSMSAAQASRHANVQIAVDLVLLTLVLHYVGGVENPFFLYYTFHVIIASILLPARATFLQATLAVLLFGGLGYLEYSGAVPHIGLAALGLQGAYSQGAYLLVALMAFTSAIYLAAYMATSIVGRLRQREDEVIALKDSLQVEQDRLSLAYRELQEVEAAKARYMRTVGHQLRAPLAAVTTLLSTAVSGAAGTVPLAVRELVERAVDRSRDMLLMVDDLLSLSRARELARPLARRQIKVDEIARKVLALMAATAADRGVKLESSINGDLPPVVGDPVGIEEILVNLVSNAVKYSRRGGKVTLVAAPSDSCLMLEVADNGIGIDPDELPHIFEEFYRSERAREVDAEGTGLGLAIVRAVVEAHHGDITVDTARDKGTRFVVRIPLGQPEQGSGRRTKVEVRDREGSSPSP